MVDVDKEYLRLLDITCAKLRRIGFIVDGYSAKSDLHFKPGVSGYFHGDVPYRDSANIGQTLLEKIIMLIEIAYPETRDDELMLREQVEYNLQVSKKTVLLSIEAINE
jgi:hypothetical protein